MRTQRVVPSAVALMILAVTLDSGTACGQPAGAEDLPSMLASAKTAADHEAIAKRYDELAAGGSGRKPVSTRSSRPATGA